MAIRKVLATQGSKGICTEVLAHGEFSVTTPVIISLLTTGELKKRVIPHSHRGESRG